MVSRARRNADEWNAVLLGGRCDDGERPVATGDAECIRAPFDRLTNERRQCPIGADDAHRDPAFARMLRQFRAHSLSAAGRRVDEQHRLSRRIGASPATLHQLLIVSVHVRSLAAVFVGLPRSIGYVRHMVARRERSLTRERWRAGRPIPPREPWWQHPRRAWQRLGSDARESVCDRKIRSEGRSNG